MFATTFRTVVCFASLALFAIAAPQGRSDGKTKPEDKDAAPPTPPFRVVERDGTMRVGKLVFRGAGFLVEADKNLKAATDDAAGDEPEAESGGEAAPEGGGGRNGPGGGGGGGGGRSGGGGGGGQLGLEYVTRSDGSLGRLERVEQDQQALFQANLVEYTSKYATKSGYAGSYGELGFVLPEGDWQFISATASSATAVRRAPDGDIVGRIRVWLLAEGDGSTASKPLDLAAAKPARLLTKLDRRRFAKFDVATETDEMLLSGARMRRVVRAGVELVSDAPCHLEANVPLEGPFFPVFEILARGPEKDAILEQCRAVLQTFRYTQGKPVAPQEQVGLDEPEDDDGGTLRPRDLLGALESLSQDAVSEFVVKRKYENPWLGIAMKAALPEDWIFYKATIEGFAVSKMPKANVGWFDLGFGTIGVLDGVAKGKDSAGWVLDRYIAGLPPIEDPKAVPKPKKGKVASYATREFVYSTTIGRGNGSEAWVSVHVIENGGRTICVMRLASGQGNQPPQRLDELLKWLKSLSITAPKPKPAD